MVSIFTRICQSPQTNFRSELVGSWLGLGCIHGILDECKFHTFSTLVELCWFPILKGFSQQISFLTVWFRWSAWKPVTEQFFSHSWEWRQIWTSYHHFSIHPKKLHVLLPLDIYVKEVLCSFILWILCQIYQENGICLPTHRIQYDMLYWCKGTLCLYLGFFKTTQKLLKDMQEMKILHVDAVQ